MGRAATVEPQKSHKPRRGSRDTARNGKTNGARYTDAQQLAAVVAMLAVDRAQPFTDAGVAAARIAIGSDVSISTLHGWMGKHGTRALAVLPQPTDEQIAANTSETTITGFIDLRDKLLDHLRNPAVIKGSDFRSAAVALGIAVDKLDKMTGISSEAATHVKRIQAKIDRLGWDLSDVLGDLERALDARLDEEALARRTLSAQHGPLTIEASDDDETQPLSVKD